MGVSVRWRALPVALSALLLACGSGSGSSAGGGLEPNTAGWWRHQVFYEVFVRSFADSDGDGVGDLQGLVRQLDALNDGDPSTRTDLGVDALWLMPVFPSPSYHGYDVTDFTSVNPAYGTLADVDALVAGVHVRGMKLVLDMVLNHTSVAHPWFAAEGTGAAAARRGWYVWRDSDPGWQRPFGGGGPVWFASNGAWYYAVFSAGMPDLNLANPAVEAALVDAMRFWLARGVDGFRLDAVRYLLETPAGDLADVPATHAFLKRIRAALAADHPHVLLVAEAWGPSPTVATYYGEGDEVQLAFAFDVADGLRASLQSGDRGAFLSNLSYAQGSLAGKDLGFLAPFLSNHDQVRILRAIGGDPTAARVAAATLFALPGTPFVYYGEELGMQGGAASPDENKRTPLPWTAEAPGHGFTAGPSLWCGSLATWCDAAEAAGIDVASQRGAPGSLWTLYRDLVALRHAEPALSGVGLGYPTVAGGGAGTFALSRDGNGRRVLFVGNLAAAASGPFTVAAGAAGVHPLLVEGAGTAPTASGGVLSFDGLAARGFAFYSLD